MSKYENKESIDAARKGIDQKLTFFRGKSDNNEEVLKDPEGEFFEKIKGATGYSKRTNGELCSTGHALFVSRYEQKKVFFYTDDYPAKDFFSPFFDYQQIGQIKDSADLIVLLFWMDESFTTHQLDSTLSALYSQYVTDVTLLKERLQSYLKNNVDASFIRTKKQIAERLRELIAKLDKLDFTKITELWTFFEENKAKSKEVYEMLKQFDSILELELKEGADTLLAKITRLRNEIKTNKIYRFDDFFSN
ncbi:hypothetical protein [Filimonas lacunae]|nr:hypothetical protein [Filimonas lacunae]